MKISEVAAWKELLLGQRINENEVACANFCYKLDHLAEFYGIERKNEENV